MTFNQLLKVTRAAIVAALVMTVAMSSFASDYVVKMKRKSGVYAIPCEVNGVKRDFIFDTGAANTSLSQEFVNELLRKRRLLQTDFTGAIQTRNASGVIDNNTTINIRQLKVGNRMIYNVRAIIAVSQKAPLLLGLNAIDLLGEWSVKKDLLVLHDYDNPIIVQQNTIPTNRVIVDDPPLVDFEQQVSEITPLEPQTPDEVTGNATHPSTRLLAYKGDAEAQYRMGIFYLNGDGVDSNAEIAVHWLRLSAMQNYRPAQRQLAECYSLGVGVDANEDAAEYWRQMAEREPAETDNTEQP